MREAFAAFHARHPEFRFRALGARANATALDLSPFGEHVELLDPVASPEWVERYHAANRACFPGELSLPGWVLVDLYLMPAAIGLVTCPARLVDLRPPGLADDDEAVAAAYYAAPAIEPGTVIGVSLISLCAGIGVAGLVKAFTLKMLRARLQRGIAQWTSKSLRVHTRMGALRLEGRVPAAHGRAAESFVYSVDLTDEARWSEAMSRGPDAPLPEGCTRVPLADLAALTRLAERAERGERITIVPPGISRDGACVSIAIDPE